MTWIAERVGAVPSAAGHSQLDGSQAEHAVPDQAA